MANTRQIKGRIGTAANISKITKAMEMVSASKMRRAQQQALATRPYTRALQESLQKVAEYTNAGVHPLLSHHEEGKDVMVIFSTDRGLCGGLNTNLFKSVLHWLKDHPNPEVVVIGKKAVVFARKMGLTIAAQFTALPDKSRASDILPIATLVTEKFLSHEYHSIHIVYMDFVNTLSQKVHTVQLLPISLVKAEHNMENITAAPAEAHALAGEKTGEYKFEPNPADILSELLPYYLENTLYQTLLEAKASEHSARMVAMKNASDNAKNLVSELRLLFNKSRQAAITSELLDITTATMTIA